MTTPDQVGAPTVARAVLPASALLALILLAGVFVDTAEALPFFSRQVGRDCSYCHIMVGKLNDTGRTFRASGYRFQAEGGWLEARDVETIPVSFELQVNANFDETEDTSGGKTNASELEIASFDIAAGGAFGKTGKVSALGVLSIAESSSGTRTVLKQTTVQVNDLAGPVGAGVLNFKVGDHSLGLPFLDHTQRVFEERYLAERTMNVLTRGQKLAELNGNYMHQSHKALPTHRYSVGVTSEDLNDDDKFKGFYATYGFTYDEIYSVGAMYRNGEEAVGSEDVNYNRYGVAAEAQVDPVVLTAGYFREERGGGFADRDDYLVELIFAPEARYAFAGRYEYLEEDGKDASSQVVLMGRYNVLSNMHAQLEYSHLDDDDQVVSSTGPGSPFNQQDTVRLMFFMFY